MILCWIILIASVLAVIIGCLFVRKSFDICYDGVWEVLSPLLIVVGVIFALIMVALLIVGPIESDKELSLFMSQKEYIENYEPTSEYDTAAIASKKIELNEWLYDVQYTKKHHPICSFFGDEILELEPIQ